MQHGNMVGPHKIWLFNSLLEQRNDGLHLFSPNVLIRGLTIRIWFQPDCSK